MLLHEKSTRHCRTQGHQASLLCLAVPASNHPTVSTNPCSIHMPWLGRPDAADRISIPRAWQSPRQHTQVTCSLMRNQECNTSSLLATRHTRSSTASGVSASGHVMQPVKCSRREVAFIESPLPDRHKFFLSFSSAFSATAQ